MAHSKWIIMIDYSLLGLKWRSKQFSSIEPRNVFLFSHATFTDCFTKESFDSKENGTKTTFWGGGAQNITATLHINISRFFYIQRSSFSLINPWKYGFTMYRVIQEMYYALNQFKHMSHFPKLWFNMNALKSNRDGE